MSKRFMYLIVSIGAACTPVDDQLSSDVKNAIAVCSSGLSISSEARLELSTRVKEILEGGDTAQASAEISNAIRGIAFTEEGLANENVLKAFETYNSCVQSDLSAYIGTT